MFHGVFDIPHLETLRIVKIPLMELARSPQFISPAILGVLLVYWCRGSWLRPGFILFSMALLLLTTGLLFTGGVLAAGLLLFGLTRCLAAWQQSRPASKLPLAAAWLATNGLLLPFFFVKMPPLEELMEAGELTQCWGLGFLTLRVLHYQGQALRGGVDVRAAGAFLKYLHYLIHVPSFSLGPYQTFRQFTYEVDTCHSRLGWRSLGYGLARIALGLVKAWFLFMIVQRKFFYCHGYYGPFASGLFAHTNLHPPAELWFLASLYVLRLYLFISSVSDGVIGMNWMMGIRVPENFQQPFLATNVIDFWRRWHCGVGTFLRDEIFLPVGGVQHRLRGYLLTFAYCGFWHFPVLGALVLFPLLQTTAFMLTHGWIDSWRWLKTHRPRWHELARRCQLVDSPISRLAGSALTLLVFMITCLFVFDHRGGGLPMLRRMFGLPAAAAVELPLASQVFGWTHVHRISSPHGEFVP